RNAGVAAAQSEIVAVTDAGVRLGSDWLRLITEPVLSGQKAVDVVCGFFVPDAHTPFERAMGATVLPAVEEIDPASFLPSSRSIAFRKSVWKQIGGYPEWLDYCEDVVFDLTLRRSLGARFVFEPRAVAYFRPRSDLGSFFRQYYRYARGDGEARLWPRRHLARYAAYLFVLAALQAVSAAARGSAQQADKARVMGLATLIGGALYLRRPVVRLLDQAGDASLPELAAMLALLPLIRLTGDVAKMVGYPVGWLWRLRRRPR
ncbi:MAG: glycosyl transferase family 2, partial [Chloroflexota bacterium]|nr:glycosyl transferase family 2 [Chloroflexota bacterium]